VYRQKSISNQREQMAGPQIGECVRNRPKVVHARCVCKRGVYEIYNSSAATCGGISIVYTHVRTHMHQRNDLVGDRFLRKEAEMPREIYRALWSPRLRWIDACTVVTRCTTFYASIFHLSNSLCVHSTNCITTFCSSTKKVDEEATPANFP
jgi:hypothetical protein